MFSGIIEHQGKILSIQDGVFRLENNFALELTVGQSIAHDGACMTITKYDKTYYEFFIMKESLSVTNFATKNAGDMVNIERCIKLSDRIDGHIVSGHIDTIGKVIQKDPMPDGSLMITIGFEKTYNPYIIRKGSVAINGVSLTIVDDLDGMLIVSLIPLTQSWTNLGTIGIGESVNLEFDMMGKYIEKMMNQTRNHSL